MMGPDRRWTADGYDTSPVLLLGDSNTYRAAQPCYSYDLMARTYGAVGSQVVTPQSEPTYCPRPFRHEGHSGYTTAQILDGLQNQKWMDCWSKIPKKCIYWAGVNDVLNAVAQATTLANDDAILAALQTRAPGIEFWVVLLPPTSGGTYGGYAATIAALNTARTARWSRKIDLVTDFNTATMLLDGLHLSTTGTSFAATRARRDAGL